MRRLSPLIVSACAALIAATTLAVAQEGLEMLPECDAIFAEDFEDGMDGWWVEGGERVWVEDGRLHVRADPPEGSDAPYVATVWHERPFEGDLKIEYDAHVISSSAGVNNINFFFYYSYPGDRTLFDTREERADADYAKYHELPGYIVTFLKDTREESLALPADEQPARVRIRRCPGFHLLDETYQYHCRTGRTYHCQIVKRGDQVTFSVDGNALLTATDDLGEPHTRGLIGLRTFRTNLWWDNIRISRFRE
ncbi:MAG: DUF1961 family protein [Armatimonadota bacterium]